jgi:glycine/D-amino acid oxidase-like deaminating enzyme
MTAKITGCCSAADAVIPAFTRVTWPPTCAQGVAHLPATGGCEDADYAWGGHIGITYNRLPDVGRQGRSIWYAHGFSGQGVVLSGILGKVLAEAVDGDQSRFDVFSRIRHMPFPGGLLRRPALTLGMLYYRLRDLLS